MKKPSLFLACASLLALAACSSTGTSDSSDSTARSAMTNPVDANNHNSMTGSGDTNTASSMVPNATVTLIESLPADTSIGSSGTAGTASSSGSPMARSRVTVRLDDGTTRSVNVDMMPSYKAGDRVNLNNGMITPSR